MYCFVLYLLLIPLFIGFSLDILYYTHNGIVWLCIVFSFLSERLFDQDYEDGSLELYCLSHCSLQFVFLNKLIGVWLRQLSTLIVCLPLLVSVYHLEQSFEFYITTLLGSLGLSLLVGFYSCFMCGIHSTHTRTHHLIALPALLPLVLFCTTLNHSMMQWVVLLGYVMVSLCVVFAFVLITFQALLSK
jgi:heme exporter protein B